MLPPPHFILNFILIQHQPTMPDSNTKLHQLIAALPDRQAAASRNVAETIGYFTKQAAEHFTGFVKVTTALDANRAAELEKTDEKPVVTNVHQRLDYTTRLILKAFDVQRMMDEANCTAKADVVFDGVTILKQVPAITLLNLEKQLGIIADMIEKSPTRPSDREWVQDPDRGQHFWIAKQPKVGNITEQQPYSLVLLQPTDKHPGQAIKEVKVVPIARVSETARSGAIVSQEKAYLLARIQELKEAVTRARQLANETAVTQVSALEELMQAVFGVQKLTTPTLK